MDISRVGVQPVPSLLAAEILGYQCKVRVRCDKVLYPIRASLLNADKIVHIIKRVVYVDLVVFV